MLMINITEFHTKVLKSINRAIEESRLMYRPDLIYMGKKEIKVLKKIFKESYYHVTDFKTENILYSGMEVIEVKRKNYLKCGYK